MSLLLHTAYFRRSLIPRRCQAVPCTNHKYPAAISCIQSPSYHTHTSLQQQRKMHFLIFSTQNVCSNFSENFFQKHNNHISDTCIHRSCQELALSRECLNVLICFYLKQSRLDLGTPTCFCEFVLAPTNISLNPTGVTYASK